MIKAGTWEAKALFIHDSYNCEHRGAMCSKTLAKDKRWCEPKKGLDGGRMGAVEFEGGKKIVMGANTFTINCIHEIIKIMKLSKLN